MTRLLSITTLLVTVGFAGFVFQGAATASTADGSTPAEETACDGATGVNHGLCVAYCEATDCDDATVTHADDSACTSLADMFSYNTGSDISDCFGDGGSGEEPGSCTDRCKTTAVRRLEACFREKIIIPKDRVNKRDDGRYEFTAVGEKIHGSLGSGELIECGEWDKTCTIKGRDCATGVDVWLESCASRCLK